MQRPRLPKTDNQEVLGWSACSIYVPYMEGENIVMILFSGVTEYSDRKAIILPRYSIPCLPLSNAVVVCCGRVHCRIQSWIPGSVLFRLTANTLMSPDYDYISEFIGSINQMNFACTFSFETSATCVLLRLSLTRHGNAANGGASRDAPGDTGCARQPAG